MNSSGHQRKINNLSVYMRYLKIITILLILTGGVYAGWSLMQHRAEEQFKSALYQQGLSKYIQYEELYYDPWEKQLQISDVELVFQAKRSFLGKRPKVTFKAEEAVTNLNQLEAATLNHGYIELKGFKLDLDKHGKLYAALFGKEAVIALVGMGYKQMATDIHIKWKYDPFKQTFAFKGNLTSEEFGHLNLSIKLNSLDNLIKHIAGYRGKTQKLPAAIEKRLNHGELVSFKLSYEDTGMAKRWLTWYPYAEPLPPGYQYSSVIPDNYYSKISRQMKQSGVSAKLADANAQKIKAFIQKPDELTLETTNSEPVIIDVNNWHKTIEELGLTLQ
ncbi:hypothetical protein [Spartinivicinus poritis]|uniref:Uncharacterized protein n=1 Tax=Spartinivicinus poritis TaxID=2994640 RepID=A0ABT5UFH6_9GAMM|nr:hypothetical protein [Spartinivicinus sp. A2-2]MDE1465126.1 hypothetical protein [Spartinivicinus sp. A2-2]